MVRRSCSVSGGTKRVLFTMSCWNLAIPLRAIGYNWFVWAVHCEKNGWNMSKDMIKLFFFNKTTLGLMSLKSHVTKNIFGNAQMGCFTAPAVFSGHCSFLLVVPKDQQGHRFTSFAEIENWISKDESFFRDGIRKLPERWEKIVSSDGQYFNWSVHSFCFEINAKKRIEFVLPILLSVQLCFRRFFPKFEALL